MCRQVAACCMCADPHCSHASALHGLQVSGRARQHQRQLCSQSPPDWAPSCAQVPAAQAVPRGWLKVNSTKKTTRYHPPEVLRAYDRLAVAQEATAAACSAAWQQILLEFRGQACQELRRAVAALAHLDCLHSLALLSCSKVSPSAASAPGIFWLCSCDKARPCVS